jgi:DNA-binding XRE family transcriptional regulator
MKQAENTDVSPRNRKKVDTSTYSGRFAIRLKTLREKAGMSVDELAEKSGIPRTTLYNWESGTYKAVIDDPLIAIAVSIGVNVRTLMPKE